MVRMWTSALLCTLMVAAAGCGGGSPGDDQRVQTSTEGGFDPLPIATDFRSVIAGLNNGELFLTNGAEAAAYSFRDGAWRQLGSLPETVQGIAIGSIGSTVLVVGEQCGDMCYTSNRQPGKVVVLTSESGSAEWTSGTLAEEAQEPFAVAAIGQMHDEYIFLANHSAFAVRADGSARKIDLPERFVWRVCVANDAMLAIVSKSDRSEAPSLPAPRVGPSSGDAEIQQLVNTEERKWSTVPGSGTEDVMLASEGTDIAIPPDVAYISFCTGDGPALANGSQTFTFSDGRWKTLDTSPREPLSGSLVAEGGATIAVEGNGGIESFDTVWRPLKPATSDGLPSIWSVAVVGDRVFQLEIDPSEPNVAPVLREIG